MLEAFQEPFRVQYGLVKDDQTSEVSKVLSPTVFDVILN
jgi:hypothetical protein